MPAFFITIRLILPVLFFGFLSLSITIAQAQTILYGSNNFVEYQKGTLPIVISVPHDGSLVPASIPDRTCNSPVTVTDSYTRLLANEISTSLFNLTGCYPHIVYCNLKRTKLDCNRSLTNAACGNAEAMVAWQEFHSFIDTAQHIAQRNYNNNVFYIDLHGHGHTIQRLELGYLLTDSELELPDSILNTSQYVGYSTIQNLATSNIGGSTHSQLLRGSSALGTLLGNSGFPSVPSMQIPYPGTTTNYFNGAYNVANHTSYLTGNSANGVQIETNYTGVRNNTANRKKFADSLTAVLVKYLNIHRNVTVQGCSNITLPLSLTHFSGQKINNIIELRWTTEQVIGNNFFHIERSNDEQRFVEIGRIRNQLPNSATKHYQFVDANFLHKTNYYRLKQVDESGRSVFSKTIAVKAISTRSPIAIFPNPLLSGIENITIEGFPSRDGDYIIYNSFGQKISSDKMINNKVKLKIMLTKGVYYLLLKSSGNDFKEAIKMIVE